MKDIPRSPIFRSFQVRGRFFATSEPQDSNLFGIDGLGRLGNYEEAMVVLEYCWSMRSGDLRGSLWHFRAGLFEILLVTVSVEGMDFP